MSSIFLADQLMNLNPNADDKPQQNYAKRVQIIGRGEPFC
jgi:hypothetical protein